MRDLTRRDTFKLAAASGAVGMGLSTGVASGAQGSGISFRSARFPDRISGGGFEVNARFENTGSATQVFPAYYFDGEPVRWRAGESGNGVPFGSGDEETIRFDQSLEQIRESMRSGPDPGNYAHSIRLLDREPSLPDEPGRADVLAVTSASVAVGDPDEATESGFGFLSATFPDRVSGEFEMSAKFENTGDPARVFPAYYFDGRPIFWRTGESGNGVSVGTGGEDILRLDSSLEDIRESMRNGTGTGKYPHSIRLLGQEPTMGERTSVLAIESASVTIGDTGGSGLGGSGPDSVRERGFFTNGGSGPLAGALGVFNLTVAGFLLSVGGIIYQMLQE